MLGGGGGVHKNFIFKLWSWLKFLTKSGSLWGAISQLFILCQSPWGYLPHLPWGMCVLWHLRRPENDQLFPWIVCSACVGSTHRPNLHSSCRLQIFSNHRLFPTMHKVTNVLQNDSLSCQRVPSFTASFMLGMLIRLKHLKGSRLLHFSLSSAWT